MVYRIIVRVLSFSIGNIKLLLVKFFHFGRFKYCLGDRISLFSSIGVLNGGRLKIGKKCVLNPNTVISAIGGLVVLGDNCFVNRNCQIVAHESIRIGNNVMIGPNVVILDHDHKVEDGHIEKRDYVTKEIVIGKDVWIGANCVILKGVTIGDGAVVAAGTIVTHDCPAHSLVVQKRKTEILKIG